MKSPLTPLKGKLIVKRDPHHKISEGGVIYGKEQASDQGIVISAGESKEVKDGDRIMFTKFAGNTREMLGEEYYIVDEKLVLAVLG